jgi:hypothetical protein
MDNTAKNTLREMRNALELDLMALQQWYNRETEQVVKDVLQKRIDNAAHALTMISSEKRSALLEVLSGGSRYNDNVLISALEDLRNWDQEMIDKWETMDLRINHALGIYREGVKV